MTTPRIMYRGVAYPWLCDAMGHLATKHYMSMFDDAAYHFLHEIGSHFEEDRKSHRGWADVRHLINYKAETHEGVLIVIESAPTRLGKSSVDYLQTMKNIATGEILAEQEARTVRFDLKARKSMTIEEEIRSNILAWMNP